MGRKRKTGQLTPLELEIMKVLWDTGPATVQTVQERLAGEPRLAYTTVQTMLNVLHRKGKVKRALKSRAYEYEPVLSREKATSAAVRDILNRLFGGSAESLVMSLVESRHLTCEKLARLSRLVETSQAPREPGKDEPGKGREASHGND